MIEESISRGAGVLVGWLHAGDLTKGEPPMCDHLSCGHWSVITGYQGKHSPVGDQYWVLHDPMGYPLMQKVATINQGLASQCGSASPSSTTGGWLMAQKRVG